MLPNFPATLPRYTSFVKPPVFLCLIKFDAYGAVSRVRFSLQFYFFVVVNITKPCLSNELFARLIFIQNTGVNRLAVYLAGKIFANQLTDALASSRHFPEAEFNNAIASVTFAL